MTSKLKEIFTWLPVAIVLICNIIIIVVLMRDMVSALELIGWVGGAVIPALSFLNTYIGKRSLRFFLLSQRLRGFLTDHVPAWSIAAQFKGKHITDEVVEEAIKRILGKRKEASVKTINPGTRQITLVGGPTLEITHIKPLTIADRTVQQQACIEVLIRNYRVGYKQAAHAIRREIMPLLEDISSALQASDAKYTMTVNFDKNNNPFFGLYLAHFNPEKVSSFFVRLKINEYEPNDTVLVSSDKIAINAFSQNALQNLALEFLTYDLRLEERFSNG